MNCPCGNLPPLEPSDAPVPTCKVLCKACVEFRLEGLRERRRRMAQERNQQREVCEKQLEQHSYIGQIIDLQEQVQAVKERAQALRRQCAQKAMDVARKSCENDERRQQMEVEQRALVFRPYLTRLQSSLLDGGSLTHALEQGRRQVRLLRFEWAKRAFLMHRLDVTIPPETTGCTTNATTSRPKIARGIGKIGGLPLPHAGAELYGVLPPQELESALRLVASLTSVVASCLAIILPHPILLRTTSSSSSLASNTHDLARDIPLPETSHRIKDPVPVENHSSNITVSSSLAASTASLANLMGQTAKKVWGGATAAAAAVKNPLILEDTAHSTVVPPSMDSNIVKERIKHATAAILAEDHSSHSSSYSLSAEVTTQDQYTTALQLLQNDIVILCIRAGVPVAKLWPAQALLLNLQALHDFCKEQVPGV